MRSLLIPPVFLLMLLLMFKGLVATTQVGLGLLVLLILLMYDILIGDFKLLLLGVVVGGIRIHLRHVEDLEHGVEVEMLHVQTLQDDLRDDEVDVVLLQLDLQEEVQEEALGDGTLTVTFGC